MSEAATILATEYFTPQELAREMNVAQITLARWRARKVGPPFIRVGLRILYRRDSYRKWLERLETKPQF
jgi:hypothetical protein